MNELLAYSDSDSDGNVSERHLTTQTSLNPLCQTQQKASSRYVRRIRPASSVLDTHIDDRAQHEQRVRSFSHVDGNFPTFVCIALSNSKELNALFDEGVAMTKRYTWHTFARDELHLSVSRTTTLRRNEIPHFVDAISTAISLCTRFDLSLSSVSTFVNDECTRSFRSFNVIKGVHEVCNLISCIDRVMLRFGLPLYYENPRPHVTFQWRVLGENSFVPQTNTQTKNTCNLIAQVLECRIGDKIFRSELHSTDI